MPLHPAISKEEIAMMEKSASRGQGTAKTRRFLQRGAILCALLVLPLVLGAWKSMTGRTINPRYVQRIQDGTTKKQEIMLYFGDPQEIKRTADGLVYVYKSFKDAPAMPYKHYERKIAPQSDQLYLLPDKDHKVKKPTVKMQGKILKSTLRVRFKPDGDTVMSHEYKEF